MPEGKVGARRLGFRERSMLFRGWKKISSKLRKNKKAVVASDRRERSPGLAPTSVTLVK
jgi:hypothetical protein